MKIQLTVKELAILKESLRYSIMNVQDSPNHSHETYPQKREKLNELEDLKSKLSKMAKEMGK